MNVGRWALFLIFGKNVILTSFYWFLILFFLRLIQIWSGNIWNVDGFLRPTSHCLYREWKILGGSRRDLPWTQIGNYSMKFHFFKIYQIQIFSQNPIFLNFLPNPIFFLPKSKFFTKIQIFYPNLIFSKTNFLPKIQIFYQNNFPLKSSSKVGSY